MQTQDSTLALRRGIDGQGDHNESSYRHVLTDGGRKKSKHPRQRNDCTVRALALACGVTYDEAHDTLMNAGRLVGKRFIMSKWLDKQPWARKIPFPALKGQKRMTPPVFVDRFPTGLFICKVAKHVFTVIDGVVHDEFKNRSTRCIYSAWEITRIKE